MVGYYPFSKRGTTVQNQISNEGTAKFVEKASENTYSSKKLLDSDGKKFSIPTSSGNDFVKKESDNSASDLFKFKDVNKDYAEKFGGLLLDAKPEPDENGNYNFTISFSVKSDEDISEIYNYYKISTASSVPSGFYNGSSKKLSGDDKIWNGSKHIVTYVLSHNDETGANELMYYLDGESKGGTDKSPKTISNPLNPEFNNGIIIAPNLLQKLYIDEIYCATGSVLKRYGTDFKNLVA